MNSNRIWTLGTVLVIVALVAGTWFLGASPRLAEAAVADSDRESVEGQNLVQSVKLAGLKDQFSRIDEIKANLEEARVAIPSSANLSALIGQLSALADAHPVTLTSVGFETPLPYTPTDSTDPELLAATGSVSPESFLIIPVNISFTGKYGSAMDFVDALQNGDRLFLVHDLVLNTGTMSADSDAEFSLTGQIFVLLDQETLSAAAAAVAAEAAAVEAAAAAEAATPAE